MTLQIMSRNIFALSLAAVLTGCMGGSGTAVTGGAGGASSEGANSSLEHCKETFGTLAVDDGRRSDWWREFRRNTKVTTIEPLLRLAVQQSNCFVLTSVGNRRLNARMNRITRQQRSGEFRKGSRQRKGQRVAADYYMQPSIIIDASPTGGLAAGVGGLFGSVGAMVGGGLRSKSSVVTLSLFDIRSQVQIAAAEGSSTSTNFGASMSALGMTGGGRLSGFSKTPEGKATVAAFTDSYNKMVRALRNYKAQNVRGGLGKGGTLKVN